MCVNSFKSQEINITIDENNGNIKRITLKTLLNEISQDIENHMENNNYIKYINNITYSQNIDCHDAQLFFQKYAIYGGMFSMYFKDLNKIILSYPDVKQNGDDSVLSWDDQLKIIMNYHSQRDSHHYKMILHDINELKLNQKVKYADTLNYIFHDYTSAPRKVTYNIIGIDSKYYGIYYPLRRYIIVESFEIIGELVFKHFERLHDLKYLKLCKLDKPLHYFSNIHIEADHVGRLQKNLIDKIENGLLIEEQEINILKQASQEIVQSFDSFLNSLYDFSQEHFLYAQSLFSNLS